MEKLTKDTLVLVALELDFPSLLNFCSTNKQINEKVCQNKDFWRNRLRRDFPTRSLGKGLEKYDPKELYQRLVEQKSRIITISQIDAPLTFTLNYDYGEDDIITGDSVYNNQIIKEINKDMDNLFDYLIVWLGDILYFEWIAAYRNAGKVLWDGHSAAALDYEVDDYGAVSSKFSYPEYSPSYFEDSIRHNSYFWANEEMINQIIDNYDGKSKSFVVDKIRGTIYNFIFIDDEEEENLSLEKLKLFLSKLRRENNKILMTVGREEDDYVFYVFPGDLKND